MADGTPIRIKRIVDSFAGGGGASTGIAWALGRHPDVAINHNATALAIHAANHPTTIHLCEDVYQVDPRSVFPDDDIDVFWASPDCTHFSRAKGGKPVDAKVRGLAWVVVGWARRRRPRLILMENVPEFVTWGPLNEDNTPNKSKAGLTFKRWLGYLRGAGYVVDWRVIVAADHGAPTTRKRLFIIARNDGRSIVWPTATHAEPRNDEAKTQPSLFAVPTTKPWRTAAECIDWSLSTRSIFGRTKPLADNTLKRIAAGIKRYVVDNPTPFVVSIDGKHIAAPVLIQTGYGERDGQAPRILDLHKPLGTVVAGGPKHALVLAFLVRHYTGVVGQSLKAPMSTVTAVDHHSLVTALLIKFYGNETGGQTLIDPLDTVTTKDRFGLVTIHHEQFRIADIHLRMLAPRELANAQGFPADYILDVGGIGKTAQTRAIGNSVCPHVAQAIVAANTNE